MNSPDTTSLLTWVLELDLHLRPYRLQRGTLLCLPPRRLPPGLSSSLCARFFYRGLASRLGPNFGQKARRLSKSRRLTERGRLWLELSQGEEALRDLPKDPAFLFERARAQLCLPDPEAALDDLDAALRLDPAFAWAYALRGECRRIIGQETRALAEFDRALKLAPSDPDLWVLRGNLDPKSLEEALRLSPGHFWATVLRTAHNLEANLPEAALHESRKALKADPEAPWSYVLLGNALNALGKRDEARQAYEDGIRRHHIGAWGFSLATRGRGYPPTFPLDLAPGAILTDELKSLRGQIKKGDSRIEASVLEADLLEDKGEKLVETLRGVKGDTPAWVTAFHGRAIALDGAYDEGLKLMDRALAAEPTCGWMHAWTGLIHSRRGQADLALASFDEAIKLNPRYDRVYAFKAAALLRAGRKEEAIEYFDQAIEADPDQARTWLGRSAAGGSVADHEKGSRTILSPLHPKVYKSKADAAIRRRDFKQALAEVDRVLALSPRDSKFLVLRARLNRRAGDPKQAAADLEMCRQVFPLEKIR